MPAEPVEINRIEEEADNVYKAILVCAKRARQIHSVEMNKLRQELGEVEDELDLEDVDTDREAIAIKYDKKAKPPNVALHELLDGKTKFEMIDDDSAE